MAARSAVLGAVLAAALAGSAVALGADGARVRVSPAHGGVHRTFVVGFTAPAPSGDAGVMSRAYRVSARRRRGSGCTWAANVPASASRANERVWAHLQPGRRWCRGRFRGTVTMTEGPNCSAGPPCPEFASRIVTLGRFEFRVR